MIRGLIHSLFMALPQKKRLRIAGWRFQKMRETFYRETRLDVAAKGLRNRETLLERLNTLEKRHRSRQWLTWPVFQAVAKRMVAGDDFATALKPLFRARNTRFLILLVRRRVKTLRCGGLSLPGWLRMPRVCWRRRPRWRWRIRRS